MTHDELKKNTARVLPPSGYSEKISWIIASEVPLASVAVTPISLGDANLSSGLRLVQVVLFDA